MANASLQGDVSLGLFVFPGHKGNNHYPVVKKGSFLKFFFPGGWGGGRGNCYYAIVRGIALHCFSVCGAHTGVSVCSKLPAAASCFSGTHVYNM